VLRFGLRTLAESALAAYGSSALAYDAAFVVILFIGDDRWIDAILTSPTFLLPSDDPPFASQCIESLIAPV